MLTLYHAIFQSHLQYGVLVWSSIFQSYLKKLIVLQNKALKIIGGAKWNERASPYYLKFKILKLPDMFKFESAVFKFKFNKQLLLLHLVTISPNQIPNTINEPGEQRVTTIFYHFTGRINFRIQLSITGLSFGIHFLLNLSFVNL